MSADDALLFIDSNKYLDLYRTDKGKKLLSPLCEQVDYIFVTQRVVDEVQRNKIQVAADYLAAKFKELKLITFSVPDHLTGVEAGQGVGILQEMGNVSNRLKKVNSEVDALALGILEQISISKDEVSEALARIFDRAILHSQEELQRARERREFGNPPGKASNPIGDQLTWEQILSHFRGKKRLWIISRDGDYGTLFRGKGFINRFLYEELQAVSPGAEAFLFADTVEGIRHFVSATGVKAEKRLTPREVEEIEEEEQSLLPLSQHFGEDFRRMMEQAVKPGEDFRRMMEQAVKPGEDIRRMMEQAMKPGEDFRRMMEQAVKPGEDIRRMMEQAMKPAEDIHRMMEQVANLHQPVYERETSEPDKGIADETRSSLSNDEEGSLTEHKEDLIP